MFLPKGWRISKHILFSIFSFYGYAFYETMWKNTVEPDRVQMTIWGIRISRWVPAATNKHS